MAQPEVLKFPLGPDQRRALNALMNFHISRGASAAKSLMSEEARHQLPNPYSKEEWTLLAKHQKTRKEKPDTKLLEDMEERLALIMYLTYHRKIDDDRLRPWVRALIWELFYPKSIVDVSTASPADGDGEVWMREFADLITPVDPPGSESVTRALQAYSGVFEVYRFARQTELDASDWQADRIGDSIRVVRGLIQFTPVPGKKFNLTSAAFRRLGPGQGLLQPEGYAIPVGESIYLIGAETGGDGKHLILGVIDITADAKTHPVQMILVRRNTRERSHFASKACLVWTGCSTIAEYETSKGTAIYDDTTLPRQDILDIMDNSVIFGGQDVLMLNDIALSKFKNRWILAKREK